MVLSVWVIFASSIFISANGYTVIISDTVTSLPNSSVIVALSSYTPLVLNNTKPPLPVSSPVITVSRSISLPSFLIVHIKELSPRFSVTRSTATVVSVCAVSGKLNCADITG